jgi:hypothetical protein
MRFSRALRQAVLSLSATVLVGCGTSGINGVRPLRAAIGSSLAGAQGKTVNDQDKIDETMAPGCAVNLYTPAECDRHTKASANRRAELK